MKDKLIRCTAHNGDIRVIGATTTNLVDKGVKLHNCAPTAAAAFGRMLTAGVLMGSMLKSDGDKITIQINGGGASGDILVTSYPDAHVKGYISNPKADLPINENGKLNVGGVVGKDGEFIAIKDMGLKEPYIGRVPIRTGEIGDDIAYYYTISEQTPSAVGLGVLVDKDLSIKSAGGFIIQMMPGSDSLLADLITYRLQEMPSVTDMISKGMNIEEIIGYIFENMDLKILGDITPEYQCDCSREKIEKALIAIGKDSLKEIHDDGKVEEVKCSFCNTSYFFSSEDIGILIKESK